MSPESAMTYADLSNVSSTTELIMKLFLFIKNLLILKIKLHGCMLLKQLVKNGHVINN